MNLTNQGCEWEVQDGEIELEKDMAGWSDFTGYTYVYLTLEDLYSMIKRLEKKPMQTKQCISYFVDKNKIEIQHKGWIYLTREDLQDMLELLYREEHKQENDTT